MAIVSRVSAASFSDRLESPGRRAENSKSPKKGNSELNRGETNFVAQKRKKTAQRKPSTKKMISTFCTVMGSFGNAVTVSRSHVLSLLLINRSRAMKPSPGPAPSPAESASRLGSSRDPSSSRRDELVSSRRAEI